MNLHSKSSCHTWLNDWVPSEKTFNSIVFVQGRTRWRTYHVGTSDCWMKDEETKSGNYKGNLQEKSIFVWKGAEISFHSHYWIAYWLDRWYSKIAGVWYEINWGGLTSGRKMSISFAEVSFGKSSALLVIENLKLLLDLIREIPYQLSLFVT